MVNMLQSALRIWMVVLIPVTLFGQQVNDYTEYLEELQGYTYNSSFSKVSDTDVIATGVTFSEEFYSPGFSYIMYATYADGNNIYFGGTSRFLGQTQINGIARFTGGNWLPMGSGFNGSVVQIAGINGDVYAVGGFTETGSGSEMRRVARWNGTAWEQVGEGLDVFAFSITEFQGDIYIGVANGVFRWDGSSMQRIITTFAGVEAMAVYNDALYIGGLFTGTVENAGLQYIARWDGTTWSAVGQGQLNGSVRALAVYDGSLIVGGSFTEIGGSPLNRLAKLDGNNLVSLANAPIIEFGSILALQPVGNDLYIGGSIGTARGSNAIKYTGDDWSGIGFISTTVWDFSHANGTTYLAGNFASSETARLSFVAAYDGNQQVPVPGLPVNTSGLGLGGDTYSISSGPGNQVAVGGFFSNAGSNAAFSFARLVDDDWIGGFNFNNGRVEAVYRTGNQQWIVGGNFNTINGFSRNRIARFNGTTFEQMGTGFQSGLVYHINEFESDIVAVGSFTTTGDGGTVLNSIARWDGQQWRPFGEGFNSTVLKTHVFKGELYAVGTFTMSGSDAVRGVARWTGSRWAQVGDADSPFLNGAPSLQIWSLSDFNGQLVAGRLNNPMNPEEEPIGALATLSPQGEWVTLGDTKLAGTVYDLERVGNSLYIAGSYRVEDSGLSNLVKFDLDGFQYAGNPNRVVYSLSFSGSTLWAAGTFDLVNGLASSSIAALEGFELYDIGLLSDNQMVTLGDTLALTVYVGGPNRPLNNLSGVGFQLTYDADVFSYISAEATGLFNNQNDLEFVHTTIDGTVAMSVSKTGSSTSQGNGNIAVIYLKVDDVDRFYEAYFSLREFEARDVNGNAFLLNDKSVSVDVFEVAVWPGDTNNDGTVNQNDVLVVGQFFGTEGPARSESTVFWEAQPASRWYIDGQQSPAVYADATGDGRVNQNDILPIGIHFGRSLSMMKSTDVASDPLARLTIDTAMGPGESFYIHIELSGDTIPEVLGIAGSVQFENPNLSFEDFYLMGPILPENPSHLLVFSNEDDETGTYSFAASRRAQDGLVSFENSQVTLLLTTTANIVEPFDVIINEVAYSTLGEIVVNPEIIVSFVHLVSIETGGIDIPIAYGLEQNFPNPFNPTTSITYHVPKSGEIRLSVFDMLGREVAVVVNGTVNAGTHTVNVDGRSLSSGMYIYRLQAGNQVITRKMTLVK